MKKVVILLLIILLPTAIADLYIANSADWKDIYSTGIHAKIEGHEYRFLTGIKHGDDIQKEIKKNTQIKVFESQRRPFALKYANTLNSKGFKAETVQLPDQNSNLDLAKRTNTNKYIIIDPTFGYDPVAVAPYAVMTKSYVLFAEKENIADILSFLSTNAPEKMLIYGDVDKEVLETLSSYNPDIINTGSRFRNNIEISKRFQQTTKAKQPIITNGEFLEVDVFEGGENKQPLIFIGKQRPVQDTINYLRTGGFEALVLLGNELVGSAKSLKEILDIPIFIKFAKGVTGGSELYKDVRGLEVFPLPVLDLKLSLAGLSYNTETQAVELVLKNERKARTRLTTSIIIRSNGEVIQTVGNPEGQSIEDLETRGFSYSAMLGPYLDTNLTAEVLVPYGISDEELENEIRETIPLIATSEVSRCQLEILNAEYDEETQRFEIEVQTNDKCYGRATIRNLLAKDEIVNPQSETIEIHGKGVLKVKQRMDKVDIADNPKITVQVRYGSRQQILTGEVTKEFELKIKKHNTIFGINSTIVIGVLIAIILLLIILLWRKKK